MKLQKCLITSLLVLATLIAQLHCADKNETDSGELLPNEQTLPTTEATDPLTTTSTSDKPPPPVKTSTSDDEENENENDDDDFSRSQSSASDQKPPSNDPKTNKDSDDVSEKPEKAKNAKKEGDEEEEDDDDDEEGDDEDSSSCDGRLSTFVRTFDGASFLPDDYEHLSEVFSKHGPYRHHKRLEDMLETLNRLWKMAEKVQGNKDLKDTGLYVSSVLSDKLYEAEVSAQCTADLIAIGGGLQALQPWAFKFLDSVGPPFLAGMLHGHLNNFGQFDQCIGAKSPPQESSNRTVYGRYCTLQFAAITAPIESYRPEDEATFRAHPIWEQILRVNSMFNMDKYLHKDFALFIAQATDKVDDNIYHAGLCLPSSCSGEEVAKFINAIIYPLTKMSVRIPEALCEPNVEMKEIKVTDKHQQLAIVLILSLAGVVILCTLLDWACLLVHGKNSHSKDFASLPLSLPVVIDNNNGHHDRNKNNKEKAENILADEKKRSPPVPQQVLQCFSLIGNVKHLLTGAPHHLPAIGTVQVLLSVLVFSVNSLGVYLLYYPMMYRHMDGMTRQEMLSIDHWSSWVPGLGFDGLVFIFALLTTLQQFKLLNQALEFSYLRYLLGRWFRLASVLFGSILLIYLLPLAGNGPMWFFNEQYVAAPCKRPSSLLSTFLYYSNWNDPLDDYFTRSTLNICNPESWLLSAFSQLYLFAPLLFLSLFYWPRFGLLICSVTLLVLGPLLTALPRLLTGYPSFIEPTKFISFASAPQAVTHYHMSPLLYVSALAAGVLTGYAILSAGSKGQAKTTAGGKWAETVIWLLSLASVGLIFAWQRTFLVVNEDVSTLSVTAFFAYYKLAWSVFLGLTVYLATTRPKSILGRLLNRPFLQPLAKLTTSIYLLRSLVLFYRKTSARTTEEIYHYRSFQNIVADYLWTAVLALLLHLLFEAPTLRLLSLISNRNQTSSKSSIINGKDEDSNNTKTKKDGQTFSDNSREMENNRIADSEN